MAAEGSREAAVCIPQCLLRAWGCLPCAPPAPTAARALLGRDSPSLQHQDGDRPQGQELRAPLLPREPCQAPQTPSALRQGPRGTFSNCFHPSARAGAAIVGIIVILRYYCCSDAPSQEHSSLSQPRLHPQHLGGSGQLRSATRHSREKPGELLVPWELWGALVCDPSVIPPPAVPRAGTMPQSLRKLKWRGQVAPAAQQEGGEWLFATGSRQPGAGTGERRAPGSHSHLRSRDIGPQTRICAPRLPAQLHPVPGAGTSALPCRTSNPRHLPHRTQLRQQPWAQKAQPSTSHCLHAEFCNEFAV